jgi:hypothetical protein
MRTALLAAAMSSAPAARPAIAIFPTTATLMPQVDVATEFEVVPPSEAYEEIIQEAAAEYDLDPALIRAVMQAESAFHPYAVSRAGAEGLMQLMPALADEIRARTSWAVCATSSGCSSITTATSTWHWPATTPGRATSSATVACRRSARRGDTSRRSRGCWRGARNRRTQIEYSLTM